MPANDQWESGRTSHGLHFGGFVGYSVAYQHWITHTVTFCSPSGNMTLNLKTPPSQIVFVLPGMLQVQFLRSMPEGVRSGFATKPNGWSFLHCLLGRFQLDSDVRDAYKPYRSSSSLFMQSEPMFDGCASGCSGLRCEQK